MKRCRESTHHSIGYAPRVRLQGPKKLLSKTQFKSPYSPSQTPFRFAKLRPQLMLEFKTGPPTHTYKAFTAVITSGSQLVDFFVSPICRGSAKNRFLRHGKVGDLPERPIHHLNMATEKRNPCLQKFNFPTAHLGKHPLDAVLVTGPVIDVPISINIYL